MPRAFAPTLALALALLLAGCMSGGEGDAPATETVQAAASAKEAGAVAGEAPSAPKEAYMVAPSEDKPEEKVVAYPVAIQTNAAKAPVLLDFSGEFASGDCRPLTMGGLDEQLGGGPNRNFQFGDSLAVGDVFSYAVTMTYTNTDQSWAEIHPVYGIGSTAEGHSESTQAVREPIVISWVGQGFRASEDDMAWIAVNCWYGQITTPIPYTLTIEFVFADSAIPAQAPMRVPVPPDATRIFVRGVPIDETKGVLSHFRLFDPEDQLVCECALASNAEVATVEVPKGGGDYVLLVDHTDNGFVSLAYDAPPTAEVVAMENEWVLTEILTADGGPVDQVVEFELPTVPLLMHAWVNGNAGAGGGKHTVLDVKNERGDVLRIGWGGHATWDMPDGGQSWIGIWPADWEYVVDHHAFSPGAHTAHVSAEYLRGTVTLITRQYVR